MPTSYLHKMPNPPHTLSLPQPLSLSLLLAISLRLYGCGTSYMLIPYTPLIIICTHQVTTHHCHYDQIPTQDYKYPATFPLVIHLLLFLTKGRRSDSQIVMGKNKNGNNGGGDTNKKDEAPASIVLKVDMHCHGCASRVNKCVRGVETVKADCGTSKLTVVGNVDPLKLKEKLERKTKKKVELLSPLPKKDAGGEKKTGAEKPKEISVQPPVTTIVLKMNLHCLGCVQKINRHISKTEGVHLKSIDRQKELVTVKGTMDGKALTQKLKEKMKRSVDIVPEKKDGGENKKGKEGNAGGGGGGGGDKPKVGGDGGKKEASGGGIAELLKSEPFDHGYYLGAGYVVEQLHPPQMFSDENPNACSVM